nr:MAG TPA: hypothetical protein [Caudoviricetes sp.]
MKKQHLTQVITGGHNTTAIPIWARYGQPHAIPTIPMQTYLCQRLSTSNDLYSSNDLKQYMNKLTGSTQRAKASKW